MKLNIGDKAPVFQGKDQDGNNVNLESFLGKKVVLYFYPNDDTPGCTTQSCNLRDNYNRFLSNGYEVLGVSANDEESHRKFIAKYNLPFTLIADTDTSINELYGVWVEKNMYGNVFMGTARTTFVIDENGYITDIIATTAIDKENHADQILGGTKEAGTTESSSEGSTTESSESVAEKVSKPKAKKPAAKKTPAKKTVAKKKTASKPAKKKAAAKKPVAKKTAPKKKVAAKKKTAAKKAVAKKKITKKATAKKATPKKKTVAKKKTASKKPAAKKAAPKKKAAAKKKKSN